MFEWNQHCILMVTDGNPAVSSLLTLSHKWVCDRKSFIHSIDDFCFGFKEQVENKTKHRLLINFIVLSLSDVFPSLEWEQISVIDILTTYGAFTQARRCNSDSLQQVVVIYLHTYIHTYDILSFVDLWVFKIHLSISLNLKMIKLLNYLFIVITL